MSEKFDDGGNAFACINENGHGSSGMTLLDYFAGQIAAGHEASGVNNATTYDRAAEYYYERAAAMIRRKRVLERGEQ